MKKMQQLIKPNDAENLRLCPCGTGRVYSNCCGSYISGEKIPSTPEALMRSRYTAYSLAEIEYIAKTMKPPASDGFNVEDAREMAKVVRWEGLEVVQASQDGCTGTVEFRAYYFSAGKRHVMHEVSTFSYENEKWYYTHGVLN